MGTPFAVSLLVKILTYFKECKRGVTGFIFIILAVITGQIPAY